MSNKVEATYHGGEVKQARDLSGRDLGRTVTLTISDRRGKGPVKGALTSVRHNHGQAALDINGQTYAVRSDTTVTLT